MERLSCACPYSDESVLICIPSLSRVRVIVLRRFGSAHEDEYGRRFAERGHTYGKLQPLSFVAR